MYNEIEKRFCYNPFNNEFILCNSAHNITLYNKGKQKQFNEYIRGIIHNNILYLRLYYPFNDIDNLNNAKINQASYKLLKDNEGSILKAIEKNYNIKINEIKYNVLNDLLKGLKLCNI
jgi:hypothetical protein